LSQTKEIARLRTLVSSYGRWAVALDLALREPCRRRDPKTGKACECCEQRSELFQAAKLMEPTGDP